MHAFIRHGGLLAALALVRPALVPGTRRAGREESLHGLPLVSVPAQGPGGGDLMAVIVTGDGGWTRINRSIAAELARRGIPVAGLIAPRYFWHARTPEEAAADLARILAHYRKAWGRQRAILIGYSRGAGVLPFMASRLEPAQLEQVALIALLGLGPGIDLEVHLRDYLGARCEVNRYAVAPELEKLRGQRLLCIYGLDEPDPLAPRLEPGLARTVALPGGHHFGGAYGKVAQIIMDAL